MDGLISQSGLCAHPRRPLLLLNLSLNLSLRVLPGGRPAEARPAQGDNDNLDQTSSVYQVGHQLETGTLKPHQLQAPSDTNSESAQDPRNAKRDSSMLVQLRTEKIGPYRDIAVPDPLRTSSGASVFLIGIWVRATRSFAYSGYSCNLSLTRLTASSSGRVNISDTLFCQSIQGDSVAKASSCLHADVMAAGRAKLLGWVLSIRKMAPRVAFLLSILSYLAIIPGASGMYFVSREEWGAQPPKEAYIPMTDARGVKIHYLGALFSGREHSECDNMMRSVQSDQMSGEYFDVAYSLAVCQHGYVYDGRGKGHRSGANGNQQLNADHYAVLAFLAKFGVTQPSASQITGIQDAIAYLRRAGAGNEIKGHRDGYNTECPGGPLYEMVHDGTLDPGELWDGGSHTVQAGENLDGISLKYNVPKRYIIQANKLEAPYDLTVGQKLEVPARGVPLGEKPPGDDGSDDPGDGGDKLTPFPGAEWFKSKPVSSIITAMGKRLVAVGCNKYSEGPGPQWSDVDQASYKCWQEKLGYTGADADGWPGQTSWDRLRVPWTGDFPAPDPILYEPFPGADYFKQLPSSWIVNEMSLRLVVVGCDKFSTGPGPEWVDDTQESYACWQTKLGYTGEDADGWPGAASWSALKVPRVTPLPVEPFPGESWFKSAPKSPIITEMGKRLVTQGCNEYASGPGPQWTDADRNSYRCWQQKCGYTGSDLDGWPEKDTWEKLVVPRTSS
ncbi:hypothetical protein EDB81DRAFT_862213 [Dactylonectria macrodidyma]|uniref:LysM domain-containing protein n=1 Tax=Dactylonectria macrodidyma TaxID=307937 RepID=A0A9P9IBQ9_9HYPO|nr:hypothetical protein EDB81DRAFT_862213 [Dactylonectria macrodidyma]